MLITTACFVLGSFLSSFSTSMVMLAAFRAFQGLGAGGAVGEPAVRGVLGLSWAPRARDQDGDGVPDDVDYKNIPWRNSRFDEEELTNHVATQSRARNAYEQLQKRMDEGLVVLEVQTGDYTGEDDIVRLQDDYGRM